MRTQPIISSALLSIAFLFGQFSPASAQEARQALPPSVMELSDCPSMPATTDPQLLRYLDTRGYGGGRWRSDNEEIAFTTNWTGTYQKWRMPAGGGFPQQITFFENAISGCDYSPVDPNLMLCSVAEGGNERDQLYKLSPDGVLLEPLVVDERYFHRPGGWSPDGQWLNYTRNNRNEQYFDLWAVNVYSGEQRLLWAPDKNISGGPWSPDGRYLICGEAISNFHNRRFLVDFETGEISELTPDAGPAVYNYLRWADNKNIYLISDLDRDFNGIARMSVDKPGELEWLHTPDADVTSLQLSPDGRYIGWTENHAGYVTVALASLPGLDPLPAPAIPRGIQSCGEFSWDSRYVLLQSSGPKGPGDIYRYELATGKVERLTYAGTGGLDPASFVEPEVIWIPSFDGLQVSALWYAPRGEKPAAGWPTVVEAHGGPEGQSQPWFDAQTQLYLSKGFAVCKVNPRGSTGFGKAFEHLDDIGKRLDSVRDYVAFRDYLVNSGMSSAEQIAITGGSYGGYVVLAALTFFPEAFSCGVCQFGISNFVSFLNNTASHRRHLREAEYGYLHRDMDILVEISPIHRIQNVTAPLLIMQGANDPRVPLSESTQMYEALKAAGREVELLVFADEGHGWVKRPNRLIAWSTELAFLTKHLSGSST